MPTKLTLSIDKEVIQHAKKYAETSGESLSGLVENYLKTVSAGVKGSPGTNRKVNRLRGSLKIAPDFDYKRELGKAIQKKFAK